jgi:hypothetical protein
VTDRSHVLGWVEAYERAWRTTGTDHLSELFAPDVSYRPSPWREPIRGLDDLARFWDGAREGADEPFTMHSEIVAVDGSAAVVRIAVEYGDQSAGRWRDLWVVMFDDDGRCRAFEEWPFAPDQDDGH